jgi:hypothetical protein
MADESTRTLLETTRRRGGIMSIQDNEETRLARFVDVVLRPIKAAITRMTEKIDLLTGDRNSQEGRAVRMAELDTLLPNAVQKLVANSRIIDTLDSNTNESVGTLTTVLTASLPTKGVFYFRALVIFSTAATTTGIKLAATTPAGASINAQVSIPQAADGVSSFFHGSITSSGDSVTSTDAVAGTQLAIIEGHVATSTTLGNLAIQFATEFGGSAVTVYAKSALIVDVLV